MIATIPFNLLASFWIGLGFALAAATQLGEGRSPWGRELRTVLSFEVLIYWPAALYLFLVHRNWSVMYVADGASVPALMAPLVLGADLGALLGGYRTGAWLVVRRGDRRAMRVTAASLAVLLLFALVWHSRLMTDGDRAGYLNGTAARVTETKLVWVLAVGQLGLIAAGLFTAQALRQERLRQSSSARAAARNRSG